MKQAGGAQGIKGFWKQPSTSTCRELVNKRSGAVTPPLSAQEDHDPGAHSGNLPGNASFSTGLIPPLPFWFVLASGPNKILALKS